MENGTEFLLVLHARESVILCRFILFEFVPEEKALSKSLNGSSFTSAGNISLRIMLK